MIRFQTISARKDAPGLCNYPAKLTRNPILEKSQVLSIYVRKPSINPLFKTVDHSEMQKNKLMPRKKQKPKLQHEQYKREYCRVAANMFRYESGDVLERRAIFGPRVENKMRMYGQLYALNGERTKLVPVQRSCAVKSRTGNISDIDLV